MLNIIAAWLGMSLGCLAGAIPGLFFHGTDWLGGYSSWRRRLVRLGHISFFGLAFVNLGFAYTVQTLALTNVHLPGLLFLLAAVTMPLLCYLAAWRDYFRHLFFIPALSLLVGIIIMIGRIWT